MAKSAASERGRYRAAARDYARAYNAKHPHGFWMLGRGSFPNLHMRRKHPGWLREDRWSSRLPYAERKAKSEYKGYAPLMDGTRLAEPKWRQRRLTPSTGGGMGGA